MKMLRIELSKHLKTIHPRVYFQQAPAKREYPYLIYNLPNSFDNEQQEVFVLDVDVWDYTDDTTTIEDLSSAVWKALNHHYHIDENIQFSVYRATRLVLEDEDPTFKRRKLIFDLRYISRN